MFPVYIFGSRRVIYINVVIDWSHRSSLLRIYHVHECRYETCPKHHLATLGLDVISDSLDLPAVEFGLVLMRLVAGQ